MSDADTDDDEVDADAADVTGFAIAVTAEEVPFKAMSVVDGAARVVRVVTTALVLSVASPVERTAAGGCA